MIRAWFRASLLAFLALACLTTVTFSASNPCGGTQNYCVRDGVVYSNQYNTIGTTKTGVLRVDSGTGSVSTAFDPLIAGTATGPVISTGGTLSVPATLGSALGGTGLGTLPAVGQLLTGNGTTYTLTQTNTYFADQYASLNAALTAIGSATARLLVATLLPVLPTIANPTTTLTTGTTAGGTLAAATYLIKYTLTNANGETLASATEQTQAAAVNTRLTVTGPAAVTGATSWSVYVTNGATGTETRQASGLAFGAVWTEPTGGLIAGAALPASNTTTAVPSTLTLEFVGQGSMSIPSAVALKINGPYVAPPHTTITGGGTVTWASNSAFLVPWASTSGDGSSGNPWAGWTTLVNSLGPNVVIEFPQGAYTHSTSLTPQSGDMIQGNGPFASVLTYTGTGTQVAITAASVSVRVTVRDLQFSSTSATKGIVVTSARDVRLSNIFINGSQLGYSTSAIELAGDGTTNGGSQTATFDNVVIWNLGPSTAPGDAIVISAQGANGLNIAGGNVSGVNRVLYISHTTGTDQGITIRGIVAENHVNASKPMFDVQGVSGFSVFGGYYENAVAQDFAIFRTGAGIAGVSWFGGVFVPTGGATSIFEFQTATGVFIDGSQAVSSAVTNLVLATTAGAIQHYVIHGVTNVTNTLTDGVGGTSYAQKLVTNDAVASLGLAIPPIAGRALTFGQPANNTNAVTGVRATDTSPTGLFLQLVNAAQNVTLFGLDVTGTITTPSVSTAALKTATGSASGSLVNQGNVNITMNDYSFSPNVQNTNTTATQDIMLMAVGQVDSGNTTSSIKVINGDPGTAGSTTNTYVARWRYVTASDNPRIWVIADATGTPQQVWASDDPTGDDITSPLSIQGGLPAAWHTYKYGAADLTALAGTPTQQEQMLAQQYIQAWDYRPSNQPYRVLAIRAAGWTSLPTGYVNGKPTGMVQPHPAPAQWIRNNAVVNIANGHLCTKATPTC